MGTCLGVFQKQQGGQHGVSNEGKVSDMMVKVVASVVALNPVGL